MKQENSSNPNCLLCGQNILKTINYCFDRPELWVGKCPACNLEQLCDHSHIGEEYYASDSHLPSCFETERRRQLEWNRKRIHLLKSIIPEIESMNCLDFGCGTGGFLQYAQSFFKEVVGFDISKQVCESHQEMGWKCSDSLDVVGEDIDILVMFHVLEHIPNPWDLLKSLAVRFPNLDKIVIEVPNTNEALNALFKNDAYRQNHYSAEHILYFTSQTLHTVVKKANFRVLLETQFQRYNIANHFSWLVNNTGVNQDSWPFFIDKKLDAEYERILVSQKRADSIFFVCKPN